MNPFLGLEQLGQSVWYQALHRGLIWTGALHAMANRDRLNGVRWNSAALIEGITTSPAYNPVLAALVSDGLDPSEACQIIVVEDAQWACDVLHVRYIETDGRDGYCQLNLAPVMAHDEVYMIEEATRLWDQVARDNLMMGIPGTEAGLSVTAELIGQGINVAVTHVFSVAHYRAALEAYHRGIEGFLRAGGDPATVAAVAEVPIERIDAWVDPRIEVALATADGEARDRLTALQGRAGVATATLAYDAYVSSLTDPSWSRLAAEGARPLRLLWSDVSPLASADAPADRRYIEALRAPDTVVAVAPHLYASLQATESADTGSSADGTSLVDGLEAATSVMAQLVAADISPDAMAQDLRTAVLREDLADFDRLISIVQAMRLHLIGDAQPTMNLELGDAAAAVDACLQTLDDNRFCRRLWAGDGTLFGQGVGAADRDTGFVRGAELAEQSLGWLDILEAMEPYTDHLLQLQDALDADQVESVVVLGMGAAGLAPEVFSRTFGQLDGSPELLVLDSTVPDQIRAVEDDITPEETLFIVSSKDGDTVETRAFEAYFLDKVKTPDNFAAITDPGTDLEAVGLGRDYVSIFHGDPSVPEGFGVLSPFGMVPAAALGLDVEELLDRAQLMVGSCSGAVPPQYNPGVRLGAALGTLAGQGRNKLTLVTSPGVDGIGPWLEHLVAESTGKEGRGIVPVWGEPLGGPEHYGNDRVFVYIASADDDEQARAAVVDRLDALRDAGHPIMIFSLSDSRDIVQELFRWQVAVVTAAHVLGVNPFARPDVDAADDLPPANDARVRVCVDDGITVVADKTYADTLPNQTIGADGQGPGVVGAAEVLRAHLERLQPGDYLALTAFIEMNDAHSAMLQRMRTLVRDRYRVATMAGFGPRTSYATGQLHRGGPVTGLHLQITAAEVEDLAVPYLEATFGELKTAQQDADFDALSNRGRRVIRVHLGSDVGAGLETLVGYLSSS